MKDKVFPGIATNHPFNSWTDVYIVNAQQKRSCGRLIRVSHFDKRSIESIVIQDFPL
jgi:hypothetical protein